MTERNRLVAIGPDHEPEEAQSEVQSNKGEELLLDDNWAEDWSEDQLMDQAPPPRDYTWVLPAAGSLLVAGWTAFYGWAHWAEISAGGTPQLWSDWIIAWSVPVLLVAAGWLLIMRNSRREASRFADSAQALSLESQRLEERLTVVNRELSLAREFLSAQSLELESLGRVASERISEHADRLQSLVQSNGAQVDAIATVSTTALGNMGKLRDELPVVANSARDVSNQIGAAGQTASSHLEELIGGFNRLNEFGQASGRQVDTLTTRIDAALANFEAQTSQLEDIAETRFAALEEKSEAFRADLDSREVDALAAMGRRAGVLKQELSSAREALSEQEEEALDALRVRMSSIRDKGEGVGKALRESEKTVLAIWLEQVETLRTRLTEVIDEVQQIDAQAVESANVRLQDLRKEAATVDEKLVERDRLFNQQIEERRASLEADQESAASALARRMDALDTAIAQRRSEHASHVAAIEEQGEALSVRLAELETQMSAIAAQGEDAQRMISGGSDDLAARLSESREALDTTGAAIAELTDASVRLLELIQASAQHSGEDLPASVGMAEERLAALTTQAEHVRTIVTEADEKGRDLSSYVIKAEEHGREAAAELDGLQERIKASDLDHAARIDELRAGLASLNADNVRIAEQTQGELREAIGALEVAARGAVASLGQGSAAQVRELANSVGDQAAEAIDQALRERTSSAIAELDAAAAKAASTGRDATMQLRDQLALVNELTGNLETRVSHARERAQEQVDNDFARRVALITESLNSNAIDIAKSISTDVTDTSWAAYLRGDRGIFTRRAVRLLDNHEAREIAALYDEDQDFNDHVSRYIHDFEAMLRSLLSTRDGNALGVTLLSSDMGKLYVALAQSIERLRD